MDTQTIFQLIVLIVSLVFGEISKKYNIVDKKRIPLQNLTIGIIFAIVEFIITKDFNFMIATSGLLGGGTYDLLKNLNELKGE